MLLPPALFTGRKLHNYCVEAIRKNWTLFFSGISCYNDFIHDIYIEKTLKDLIIQYVPYFINKPNELKRHQPFLSLFEMKSEMQAFILETITSHFLLIAGGKQPNQHACSALFILSELQIAIRLDCDKNLKLVTHTLHGVLEHIMFLDPNDSSKKLSVELFNNICNSLRTKMEDEKFKEAFLKGIRLLVKRHLGFYAILVMRLLMYLAQKIPTVMEAYMPQLLEEVKVVENIRCVRYDTVLR